MEGDFAVAFVKMYVDKSIDFILVAVAVVMVVVVHCLVVVTDRGHKTTGCMTKLLNPRFRCEVYGLLAICVFIG